MMTGGKLLSTLGLVVTLMLASGCAGNRQDDHAWLHGTWELTFNPENDDADVLTFNPDGTVSVATVDDRQISGKYAVRDQGVALTLVSSQKIIDVTFSVSPDQSRLVFENGAYYTKKP